MCASAPEAYRRPGYGAGIPDIVEGEHPMPTLTVEAAIIDNGRILLVKDRWLLGWRLPGRTLAAGETPLGAIVQSVQEETGLMIRVGRLIGLYTLPRWRAGGDTTCLFLGLTIGGRLAEGTGGLAFFSPHALPEDLLPWYAERVEDAYAGQNRAAVRSQQWEWPFSTQDPHKLVSSLLAEGFPSEEEALREIKRRLGLGAPHLSR